MIDAEDQGSVMAAIERLARAVDRLDRQIAELQESDESLRDRRDDMRRDAEIEPFDEGLHREEGYER